MSAFVKKNRAGLAVILLALALIGYGLIKNQQKSVLNKAVRICMECVGLG